MKLNRDQKFDYIVLFVLAVASIPVVLYFHTRFLTTAIIFLGIPALYLIIRKTQNLKVVFSGVFLIGVLLGFTFDFLATLNSAWFIPDNQLLIPYRIFGFAPVDELICLVLWVLLMLLVYEHFLEKKRVEHLHIKHFIFSGVLPAFLTCVFIISAYLLKPSLLFFGYSYLVLGILAGTPLIYFAIHKPILLRRVIYAMPYFVFLFLIFELTALSLDQWSFPGQYIGYIELFSFRFPIEELIMWILMSSTIVLADYKLFVDDSD